MATNFGQYQYEIYLQGLAGEKPDMFRYVIRGRLSGGAEKIIQGHTRALRSPQGEQSGAVLVFSDITAAYRAEQALKDSERRYRTLFESVIRDTRVPSEVLADQAEQEADPEQAQLPGLWERATAGPIAEHEPIVVDIGTANSAPAMLRYSSIVCSRLTRSSSNVPSPSGPRCCWQSFMRVRSSRSSGSPW